MTETTSAQTSASQTDVPSTEITPVTESTADTVQDAPTEIEVQPAKIYIDVGPGVNIYEYIACTVRMEDPTGTYRDLPVTASEIKIRGHSTSRGEKIPYNIKLDTKTDLLGLAERRKWNLLANLYDRTQLRNYLALNFARGIGLENTSSTTFTELYVNGEYRGLYQICEPVDVGSDAVDIDITANDFLLELEPYEGYKSYYCLTTPVLGLTLGCSEPERPTSAQWMSLVSLMTKAENALLSDDWNQVLAYFDVESFARCYIVQELCKNVDYNVSSTRFYVKDGRLYEGPVWDFDLSMGNCSVYNYPEYNNTGTSGNSWEGLYCVGLYNEHLFKFPEFSALVSTLYRELQPQIVNLYSDNEIGRSRIDRCLSDYGDAIARNVQLWPTDTVYSHLEREPVDGTYEAEIAYLRDWLKQRNTWLYTYYCTE